MLVRDRLRRDPITISPDQTLADALRLTRAHRIRHLPVVVGGALAGVVSDRDIRLAMPSPLAVADDERAEFLGGTLVAEIMTREVITVMGDETIEDAAKLMTRQRIGCLPVVDATGALTGILTESDILRAFVEILGGSQPASRLEIALLDRPGELARAIRIIGDLGVNIVSIVVPSLPGRSRKTAIVHLATIDPREVVQALEAGEYTVGWPSLANDVRGLEPAK